MATVYSLVGALAPPPPYLLHQISTPIYSRLYNLTTCRKYQSIENIGVIKCLNKSHCDPDLDMVMPV